MRSLKYQLADMQDVNTRLMAELTTARQALQQQAQNASRDSQQPGSQANAAWLTTSQAAQATPAAAATSASPVQELTATDLAAAGMFATKGGHEDGASSANGSIAVEDEDDEADEPQFTRVAVKPAAPKSNQLTDGAAPGTATQQQSRAGGAVEEYAPAPDTPMAVGPATVSWQSAVSAPASANLPAPADPNRPPPQSMTSRDTTTNRQLNPETLPHTPAAATATAAVAAAADPLAVATLHAALDDIAANPEHQAGRYVECCQDWEQPWDLEAGEREWFKQVLPVALEDRKGVLAALPHTSQVTTPDNVPVSRVQRHSAGGQWQGLGVCCCS